MTTEDLELAILDIIKELYCKEYISTIKVKELKYDNVVVGYHLELGMNTPDEPMTINKEGTEEEFLKCIKDELRRRHLSDTTYSLGYKVCN